MKSAAESIIAVGLALKRQKERLPHGMFLPWISAEFEMTERTARRIMDVAEHYNSKSDIVSVLNATALYELAAPSTPQPVRDAVEELLVDGQKVSVADEGGRSPFFIDEIYRPYNWRNSFSAASRRPSM